MKRPPCHGRPGRRMGCGQENRIACASAAGLHRNPLRITRRRHRPGGPGLWPGVVFGGPCTVTGRPAERPAQPCHGGTRAARRPRRPLMMPPQPPPLRAALSPPLRRPGVPEMLGHGRGRVGRGGGSSLPTFGTASGPDSEFLIYTCKGVNRESLLQIEKSAHGADAISTKQNACLSGY